ncbi:MAG: leucyl/phenylalanyl-tRNA--protein transferase [Flavobacteriaceae bacterium]|nr:leucyl/phenylalanyl-tRNA--protein transferase [Flavobacteriaceae bacterium]
MYILSDKISFPPVNLTSPEGIIAVGGDLSVERLLLAYKSGIFPWYNEGEPIIWYSPDQRMVLFPKKLKVSKSMRQLIRKRTFKVTYNISFNEVIANCKTMNRKGQEGTWITTEMQQAYIKLHELGFAKSVEVWLDNELVGGLYGIDLGNIFCGESMFSKTSNASKIAFIFLVEKLQKENYKLLDCQVYNNHLASLGAEEITRTEFLKYLPK